MKKMEMAVIILVPLRLKQF